MLDDPHPEPPEASSTPEKTESLSPAEDRFRTCRWRAAPDGGGGAYCSHRDVQPFAGTTGFNPEAWCLDCAFFKLRRTPKKRNPTQLEY